MHDSKVEYEFVFSKRPVQWVIVIAISCVILGMMHSREVSLRAGLKGASVVESSPGIREQDWLAQVNLNSASARELALLSGVGPILASRIVADRVSKGAFESVDDLQRVRGIGPGKMADIRGMAIVTE
jgi:competence ComEA-like helix-hairpin-helix protein